MSLKSFDKFCEELILKDPGSEREVFDERQKVIRLQIAVETLLIFVAACFINSIIMDCFCKWAESHSLTLLLTGMICLMYYIIRNAAKGSYVGINGRFARKITSVTMLLMAVLNLAGRMFALVSEGSIVTNGMLSDDFLFAISLALLAVNGVISLIVLRRIDKADSSEADEKGRY